MNLKNLFYYVVLIKVLNNIEILFNTFIIMDKYYFYNIYLL